MGAKLTAVDGIRILEINEQANDGEIFVRRGRTTMRLTDAPRAPKYHAMVWERGEANAARIGGQWAEQRDTVEEALADARVAIEERAARA